MTKNLTQDTNGFQDRYDGQKLSIATILQLRVFPLNPSCTQMYSYVAPMYPYVTSMLPICQSYVSYMYSYVPVCSVCHSYVTCMLTICYAQYSCGVLVMIILVTISNEINTHYIINFNQPFPLFFTFQQRSSIFVHNILVRHSDRNYLKINW